MSAKTASRGPRYEPEERPPFIVTVGVGLQNAFLGLAPFVVLPLIVVGAAGGSQALGLWTVFATMASIGVTTLLMTVRYGPVGVGCNVLPGVSPTAIPFCILALVDGGPGTLAALVIAAGLFRMALSMRLSLLRRVVTPTVSGTIMILLIITITPLFFKLMYDVPAGAPTAAAPVCALTTFVVMVGILLRTSGALAMWAPAIGIVAGGVAAVAFGIYDLETLKQAPWVGLPLNGWSGFGFDFGMTFWTLLPAFAFVSVIDLVQTNAMSLSALRVSWREPRAIDFRRIEGGAMSNGLGTLLAGIWGGIPLTTGPRGSMIALQTGCASRDIGIFIGVACLVLAFFPKAWGLVSIIPGPVVAVYLILIMAPLLIEGMRTIIQDEFDYRKGLMVGVATMVGLGFQFDMVTLPIGGLWGSMFQQGLTTGGITMVLLTLFTELTGQGRRPQSNSGGASRRCRGDPPDSGAPEWERKRGREWGWQRPAEIAGGCRQRRSRRRMHQRAKPFEFLTTHHP